jgi:solute:Na+ symporter, SSS family
MRGTIECRIGIYLRDLAMAGALGGIDYCVIIAYLLGTLALGFAIGRRLKTGRDFFLAGRSLPWWAVGMSLVATDIGGTDIIGVGGAAYTHGLAVANFEWIGCVPAMIVAAFIFIPHFWRIGVLTIPEFMERRYGVTLRVMLAVCWLAFMGCNLGIMLFASAKMMHIALGLDFRHLALFGWSLEGTELGICIFGIALIAGLYTMVGGLAAVVYTDVLQCAVMIGGCLMVLVLGLIQVGGWSALQEKVAARETAEATGAADVVEHNELILPVGTSTPFPWTGILFGLALILSPAYWIGNQAIVQRSLGARSEFEAKASYVWGALLKNIIPVIVALPGLVAYAMFPDLSEGDSAFPYLATHILPLGLRGLFLAAFLAALMSSFDSYLNSAATIAVSDLYLRFVNQRQNEEAGLRTGRWTTLLLIVWAIGFGFWISRQEGSGIYTVFQTLMSFFQGPALAVLLAGVFWSRATSAAAVAGFSAGVFTAVSLFTLNLEAVYSWLGWPPLFQIREPFLYFSIWSFVVALSVLIVVSRFTRPRPLEEIRHLIYRRRSESDAATA